jgi:hypothetical protein
MLFPCLLSTLPLKDPLCYPSRVAWTHLYWIVEVMTRDWGIPVLLLLLSM